MLTPVEDRWLRPGEVIAELGVTHQTLRNWSDMGLLQYRETKGGHRRYGARSVAWMKQRRRSWDSPRFSPSRLADLVLEAAGLWDR